jgi:hypothetical protein
MRSVNASPLTLTPRHKIDAAASPTTHLRAAPRGTHPLVSIPVWLLYAVAGLVIIFGAYRIYLATRPTSDAPDQPARRGLYSMSKRTHLMVGIVYLLLGGGLIATSFGWNPFGGGEPAPQPTKPAPAKP